MERLPSGTLRGGMQGYALTVDKIITHAARWHGDREVVSFPDDGSEDRRSYSDIRDAALRLSNALLARGVGKGDRVATLAMNTGGHLIAWYAITGIGAVCHTLNPRFSEDQLAWIIEHAGDQMLIADGELAGLAAGLAARTAPIKELIFLTEPTGTSTGRGVSLSELWETHEPDCIWGDFEEESAAGLCYTSGTVGHPKGVLYSHRSNVLHTLMTTQRDVFDLSSCDVVMPVVPMYHANAWGLAFSAPAVGAKLVLPGAKLDGETLYQRMAQEKVTFAAAVPTVWLGLLEHMEAHNLGLPDLRQLIVGGAALPEHLLRRFTKLGCNITHAWGMTELSPVGGVASTVPRFAALDDEERLPYRLKQGRVFFGIDMRIVGESGEALAHDGTQNGSLQMHGPTVASRYFAADTASLTPDDYLVTGDIATIDPCGFVKITDREKDVIKSGGEWISSIDIENTACTYPGVALAAAIGVLHPKWDERPLLLVEVSDGGEVSEAGLLQHLATKLPKWWLPDEVRIVDAIPVGATGKIDKKALRDTLA